MNHAHPIPKEGINEEINIAEISNTDVEKKSDVFLTPEKIEDLKKYTFEQIWLADENNNYRKFYEQVGNLGILMFFSGHHKDDQYVDALYKRRPLIREETVDFVIELLNDMKSAMAAEEARDIVLGLLILHRGRLDNHAWEPLDAQEIKLREVVNMAINNSDNARFLNVATIAALTSKRTFDDLIQSENAVERRKQDVQEFIRAGEHARALDVIANFRFMYPEIDNAQELFKDEIELLKKSIPEIQEPLNTQLPESVMNHALYNFNLRIAQAKKVYIDQGGLLVEEYGVSKEDLTSNLTEEEELKF